MHVILATVGTDGDVFPHIGLASVLQARGHRVTLAVPDTYRDRCLALGLEFCSLVTTEEMERALADPDMWHPLKSGRMMARWGAPMMGRQYQVLSDLARAPGAALVANAGLLPARLVQQKLKVPLATLLLQPGLIPSCIAPPEMPGGLSIPRWFPHPLRRAYWLAVDAAGYLLVARPLNRLAKGLALPPVRRVFRWWLSPDLVIGLFPTWYAAPQPDWPPQIRLAGFARYDGARNVSLLCHSGPAETSTDLPADLRAFLDSGPPPVAFTLGTGMTHAAPFFESAVAACAASNVRGLLLTKYAHLIPPNLPPTIHHCTFAPFQQLLPRCAAIVHHGGIGTTAAALQSACPQLVLPLAWDQPDNAARVKRLGVGLTLGPHKRTSEHIARALAQLMTPAIRDQCRHVATLAVADNGLELAADWVEQMAEFRGT
jgi:rhamnosyltransferase subunit B